MVDIGCGMNRETIGMITDMDEPLGFAVGNSLEVIEAIETLKGNGPKDFVLLCETLGSYMLVLAKVAKDFDEGLSMIRDAINSGKALEKLRVFIENQGGNKNVVDDYTLLPQASKIVPIKSNKSGYISKIEAEEVGIAAMILGAGRETKEDVLDLSAGIINLSPSGREVAPQGRRERTSTVPKAFRITARFSPPPPAGGAPSQRGPRSCTMHYII